MQGRKQVYVIAATNRPDMIDPAMLRPGRLDKALYVDLPTASERHEILKTLCRKTPLDSSCNLLDISNHAKCDGLSGADLAALVREASVMALRKQLFSTSSPNGSTGGGGDDGKKSIFVTADNFASAFAKLVPSVSKKVRKSVGGVVWEDIWSTEY